MNKPSIRAYPRSPWSIGSATMEAVRIQDLFSRELQHRHEGQNYQPGGRAAAEKADGVDAVPLAELPRRTRTDECRVIEAARVALRLLHRSRFEFRRGAHGRFHFPIKLIDLRECGRTREKADQKQN